MQWLNDLPFGDNRVVQIGFLAACGIAALVLLAIVYRLVFAHRLRVPGGRTRQPRLGLVDAFSLDGQRQLVLIRRDNVEHLVMIGGPNDVLVESQITRALASVRDNNLAQPAPVAPASRRAEPVLVPAPPVPGAGSAAEPPTAIRSSAPSAAEIPSVRPESAPLPALPAAGASAPTPAVAKDLEPNRPTRPLPPRPTMPPPIAPAGPSSGRSNIARLSEKPLQAAHPSQAAPVAAPAAHLAAAPIGRKNETAAPPPSLKPETRVAPPTAVNATAAESQHVAKVEGKSEPKPAHAAQAAAPGDPPVGSAPPPSAVRGASRTAPTETTDRLPASQGADRPTPEMTSNATDPFADLDTLEAEMARLLGREKLN